VLRENFTTVSVGAFLVTYDYNLEFTVGHLIRFARSLCQNFPPCRRRVIPNGAKSTWVCRLSVRAGSIIRPRPREIRACLAKTKTPAKSSRKCSAEERILGFCN